MSVLHRSRDIRSARTFAPRLAGTLYCRNATVYIQLTWPKATRSLLWSVPLDRRHFTWQPCEPRRAVTCLACHTDTCGTSSRHPILVCLRASARTLPLSGARLRSLCKRGTCQNAGMALKCKVCLTRLREAPVHVTSGTTLHKSSLPVRLLGVKYASLT